jgi:hypothetical protein
MDSIKLKNYIIGIILFIYAVFKLFIGLTAVFGSEIFKNYLFKLFPAIHTLIPLDETIAAKAIEITFIIFGIYTMCHSFDKFELLSKKIKHTLEMRKTIYLLYGCIGLFLTFFYYLVIYTKVHIQKDINEINRYKVIGLIGGLSFLIMLPIMLLTHRIMDYGYSYIFTDIISIIIIILIILILYLIYKVYMQTQVVKHKTKFNDLFSLYMIPFNTL